MKTQMIALDRIRIDGGTQMRVTLDDQHVADLSETIDDLPPVKLIFDGSDYWLWDGFHTYFATQKVGGASIEAVVEKGTRRDAVRLSLSANAKHGLKRTREDKRRAVETALADEEWGQLSDRGIAELCAVSAPFVAFVRRDSTVNVYSQNPSGATENAVSDSGRVRKTRSGRTIKTANIGRRREDDSTPEDELEAPDEPAVGTEDHAERGIAETANQDSSEQPQPDSPPATSTLPAPRPRRNGDEAIPAKERKEAQKHYGKLIRIVRGWPGFGRLQPHFEVIAKAIAGRGE